MPDGLDGLWTGQSLLLIGLAATGLVLAILPRKQRRPRAVATRSTTPEHSAPVASAEMTALIEELDASAARVSAAIDEKLARLEAISARAEAQITRLSELLALVPSLTAVPPPSAASRSVASAARTAASRFLPNASPPAAEPPIRQPESAPAKASATLTAANSRKPSTGVTAPSHPLAVSVYTLRDSGMTPIDIAERVGVTLGEVELLLNLRDTR